MIPTEGLPTLDKEVIVRRMRPSLAVLLVVYLTSVAATVLFSYFGISKSWPGRGEHITISSIVTGLLTVIVATAYIGIATQALVVQFKYFLFRYEFILDDCKMTYRRLGKGGFEKWVLLSDVTHSRMDDYGGLFWRLVLFCNDGQCFVLPSHLIGGKRILFEIGDEVLRRVRTVQGDERGTRYETIARGRAAQND